MTGGSSRTSAAALEPVGQRRPTSPAAGQRLDDREAEPGPGPATACAPGREALEQLRLLARLQPRPPRRAPRRGARDHPQPARRLEAVLELGERRPARVGLRLFVLVRLRVQVLAADRTEAGAIRFAEDLVRELECERVAGPAREVEP